MPRQRSEHKARHRAQRSTRERARRAQFLAVATRPSPSHAKPGTSAPDRLVELGARFWPYQRRLLAGAMRGLVVSPWFAAGAGFVVAAGAFIYAPHADLDFGNGAVRLTPCTVAGCHQLVPAGVQPPEAAGGGTPLPTPTPAPSGHTHSAPAGSGSSANDSPTFGYTMNPNGPGKFQMTLTVTSSQAVGPWWLSFEVPGASDLSVTGASWQSSGTDSGTASGPAVGYRDDLAQDAAQADTVTFFVDGDGQPAGPVHCVFHDAQGKFSPEFSQS